jgi:hypothetical protein
VHTKLDKSWHGEFFTPITFAKKGLEYIEKILGKNWWKSGEYRLWDMFEKAMIIHAVRRIPKATWLNNRDQFL